MLIFENQNWRLWKNQSWSLNTADTLFECLSLNTGWVHIVETATSWIARAVCSPVLYRYHKWHQTPTSYLGGSFISQLWQCPENLVHGCRCPSRNWVQLSQALYKHSHIVGMHIISDCSKPQSIVHSPYLQRVHEPICGQKAYAIRNYIVSLWFS